MGAAVPSQLEHVGSGRSADPLGEHVFNPTEVIYIKERETHIPSWYVPHNDPESITVKQRGVPLESTGRTFTVSEVAPERRWAIGPDGEVLAQNMFERQIVLWYEEFFSKVKGKTPPDGVHKKVQPRVERFVKLTVDPQNPSAPLIAIGYRDAEHAARGSVSDKLWDAQGEEGVDRMKTLVKSYAHPKMRKMLTQRELEDVKSYMAHEGIEVDTSDGSGGLVAKLEELNGMLRDGDITSEVHSKRVALLTGAEVQPEVFPAPPESVKAEEVEGDAA